MIELIMSLVLIVSATLFGNSFSQRLSNRTKCLTEVVEAVSRMKSLITFSGYNIQKVVQESFQNTNFSRYFDETTSTEDFSLWWNQSVNSLEKNTGVNKEDKQLLAGLGSGLGMTDVTGQLSHLELYSDLFSQRVSCAKDCEKEKGRLYRILGFSFGCAVTLIIM